MSQQCINIKQQRYLSYLMEEFVIKFYILQKISQSMTDARVTYNSSGQPIYTSNMKSPTDYGYTTNTVNANANLGSNVYVPGASPTLNQVPTRTSGAINTAASGTGSGIVYRQTNTQSGPGYVRKENYVEQTGPSGGTYERTSVQQQLRPSYTQNTYVPPPVTTTTNTVPVTSTYRSTQPYQPAPMAVAAPVHPPVNTQHYVQQKNRCPKWLLGLLGLLALAGIILALLFGLGVIGGGKKNDYTPPGATPVNSTQPAGTLSVETTVVNNTIPATPTNSTPIVTQPITNQPVLVPTTPTVITTPVTTTTPTTTPTTTTTTTTSTTTAPTTVPATSTTVSTTPTSSSTSTTVAPVAVTPTTSTSAPVTYSGTTSTTTVTPVTTPAFNLQGSVQPVSVAPIPVTA